MKTFIISLERAKERRSYIIQHISQFNLDYQLIDAIDGDTLTQQDIEINCDIQKVNQLRWWLSNSAIGCALSHYNAYKEYLKTGDKAGFIVEDDVMLPLGINKILDDVEAAINENEIILLHYSSAQPIEISIQARHELSSGTLMYPLNFFGSAAAYVIGWKAAQSLIKDIRPISVTSDCWHHYYKMGSFQSFRVLYPPMVGITPFKSSINYFNNRFITNFISTVINKYKIPIIYQYLKYKRKRKSKFLSSNFSLTDKVSPIYLNIKHVQNDMNIQDHAGEGN